MTDAFVTLCADDYGLAPGIGRAIRDLIARGRLQATGCMTSSPYWPGEAALLKPLDGQADIGLHITLTDQTALAPMPGLAPDGRLPAITHLMRLAWGGRLDQAVVAAEIHRQIDTFEAEFGRAPDFLDGHQHAHQLPVIRDAVVAIARDRLAGKAWVRSCAEPLGALWRRGVDPFRAGVIAGMGRGLDRRLKQAGLRQNHSFRGVYDLAERVPYDRLFAAFVENPGPGTLVMCHPGWVDEALIAADRVTGRRETEFRFLASDACQDRLDRLGIRLSRLT